MSGITSVCRPVLWLPRSSVASCLRDAGACALRSHAGESVRVFGGMSARRHAVGWVELAKPSLRGLASLPMLGFVPQPSLQGSLSQSPVSGAWEREDERPIQNLPFTIHHSPFTTHHPASRPTPGTLERPPCIPTLERGNEEDNPERLSDTHRLTTESTP